MSLGTSQLNPHVYQGKESLIFTATEMTFFSLHLQWLAKVVISYGLYHILPFYKHKTSIYFIRIFYVKDKQELEYTGGTLYMVF